MREYRRHRVGIIGIVVLVLFFAMAIFAPALATHSPITSARVAPAFLAPAWMNIFDPGSVESREYLPDSYLTSPSANTLFYYQGIQTYGDGSGFDYEYVSPALGADHGAIRLNWTHQAGDNPSFVIPPIPMSNLPDANRFAYFTQEFAWPKDRMPSDVNITIRYSVFTTGSFANETAAGLMFKVYVWLIDSSLNWRMVYKSYPPYTTVNQERRIDLSYFDILEAWGGMIPDEDTGVQEDPADVLTFAVGIAPTAQFRFFSGTNPYQFYTGSVAVEFTHLSLFGYGDYFGILGTTDKGADAWSQLVYGSRVSLIIGILATGLSTFVGVVVGMVSGYFGGKIDEIMMRIVDFLLVIPGLPLMMVLAAFLGPTITNIIIVIAVLGWTGTARLIRSQVLAEKNKAYVESARAIGASDTYIIFRHVLPNVTPILFANITLGVVGAILSEAGLAFLGLTDPSEPSWGRMLADARSSGGFSNGAWWVVVFPGLMITVLSLAFTFVGHTLDQVLNPRLRER